MKSFMNTINHRITANKNISRCSRPRFVYTYILYYVKVELDRREILLVRNRKKHQMERVSCKIVCKRFFLRFSFSFIFRNSLDICRPLHIFHSTIDSHFLKYFLLRKRLRKSYLRYV